MLFVPKFPFTDPRNVIYPSIYILLNLFREVLLPIAVVFNCKACQWWYIESPVFLLTVCVLRELFHSDGGQGQNNAFFLSFCYE